MEVSIKMNLYVKVSFSFGLCVSIADCSTVQYYLHMIWRIIFFSLCTYVSFTRKSFCLPDENELTFELFRGCTRSTGHYLSPFATAWSDNGQPEVVYFRSLQFPPPFLIEQHCYNCPLLALLTFWPLFLGHRLHYRVAYNIKERHVTRVETRSYITTLLLLVRAEQRQGICLIHNFYVYKRGSTSNRCNIYIFYNKKFYKIL